jgi:hypothetical protein
VTPKDQVSSIARARADLEDALAGLEKLPAFDPGAAAYAAHALNNYLMVARELVEKLGGKIWCESTPGQGACFSFSVPLCEARPATEGRPPQ